MVAKIVERVRGGTKEADEHFVSMSDRSVDGDQIRLLLSAPLQTQSHYFCEKAVREAHG